MSLLEAAAGLLYTSEADHQFDPVFVSGGAEHWPVDASAFAALMQIAPGTPLSVQSLDQFFARHIERADPQDPHLQAMRPKYEALREMFRRDLRDARVFRAGEVEIRCYVVGADGAHNLVGLATTSVET